MPAPDPRLAVFDHVVVLMLENRSFDNLLGFLYETEAPERFLGRGTPVFRGVAGRSDLFNGDGKIPENRVTVGKAACETPFDMCHPCPDPGEGYRPHVNRQLYGSDEVPVDVSMLPDPAPMSGFVQDYIRSITSQELFDGIEPTLADYSRIMTCFTPDAVPVINGLAREFAVSDEWFCSVPSQTCCNRSFFHSAQSHGFVHNAEYLKWAENRSPTVFERLTDAFGADADWRLYWAETDLVPLTRVIHPQLLAEEYSSRFRSFDAFASDCAAGNLPAYTFIQPRLLLDHNDMHPPIVLNPNVVSSVLAGELLVNQVYDAVRHSPSWLRTLLVIIFDEHGGCYDHWPPPLGATPPVAAPPYPLECGFRFDRFGVRVPAIFISPRIARGTVIRSSGPVPFDHTSMVATICRRWGLDALTDRDRAAPDIGELFTLSESAMRVQTPAMAPRAYVPTSAAGADERPLHGLQQALAAFAAHVLGKQTTRDLRTVADVYRLMDGL